MLKINYILIFIVINFMANNLFCQSFYRNSKVVSYLDVWNIGFKLNQDSTANLILNYSDNSIYQRYDGSLVKINDTLFEFNYRPILELNQMMGFYPTPSNFYITSKDTILESLELHIILNNELIELKIPIDNIFEINGSQNSDYLILTDYYNPITGKQIIVNVSCNSVPYWIIYGIKTKQKSIKMTIKNGYMIIHKDEDSIINESVTLTKDE